MRSGLPDDKTVQAILEELRELERQLTNSYLHELLPSPTSLSEASVGWPQTFAVTAKDGSGAPMRGLLVRLHVTGANPQLVESTTDLNGCAVLMYIGTHAGVDRVQASAIARGPAVVSDTVRTLWVNAQADGELGEPGKPGADGT